MPNTLEDQVGLRWNPAHDMAGKMFEAESLEGGKYYQIVLLGNGIWYVVFDGAKVVEGGLEKCVNACRDHDKQLRESYAMNSGCREK